MSQPTHTINHTFLLDYVSRENTHHKWHITDENIQRIVDIIEYFDVNIYRPMTRLLLCNWQEISERLVRYTDKQWHSIEQIEEEIHKKLDRVSIAILLEVFDGDDTRQQYESQTSSTVEEQLAYIRNIHKDG